MSLTLPITSAEVPSHLQCVISNIRWQELVSLLGITLPDGFKLNISSSAPAPADRIWPWFRLDPTTGRFDRIYNYVSGQWVSPHPDFTGKVVIYRGALGTIETLEGGAAGTITATSGPFWERDTDFNAKFPVGVGTFAHEGSVAVGDTGGKDQHTLTVSEMPSHGHGINGKTFVYSTAGGAVNLPAGSTWGYISPTNEGGDDPHTNVPPYLGVFFIKRTARLYYVAT